MTIQCLLSIYYSNIYSLLSYCILVYGNYIATNTNRLERVQKRILKIVFNVSSNEIDETMKRNGIFSLSQIYRYKLLNLGHVMIYSPSELPEYFKNVYETKNLSPLRNRYDYLTPYYRTTIGQRRLDYRLAAEWNKLPANIKSIHNRRLFKLTLKNYLLKLHTQG